ncbi:Uncharacterised protein [Legionella beliardensis]|uniref:Uncharacterized protein n=1 Tax=Legionella beliardensis TaxID=91822 RepID=A0A378I1I0_9GAMM|nr:hypothetical protein [Legionella beliardensis]STX28843.1 Uncharacterised protein [Legionella beliardensis]
MPYTNTCPISLEPLSKEQAFLIKVPKQDKQISDKYYYIGDEKTLKQLFECPFTRRKGDYYALKLSETSSAVISKLLAENDKNTLIEDNDLLAKIDAENRFNWQVRYFGNRLINNQPNINIQDLVAVMDRSVANTRHLISDYKINFLRHPSPRIGPEDVILRRGSLARYCKTVNKLMNNALVEEHDLLFLIHSYILISKLEDSRYKTALQNAVANQLVRYLTGLLLVTNAVSVAIDVVNNGFSSSAFWGVLKILLIDRAQDSLQHLFSKNMCFNAHSILYAIISNGPKQLANPANLYVSAKSATTHAYEFVKTNLSFFHNKFIKSEPVQYELPEDLEALRESAARGLRGYLN